MKARIFRPTRNAMQSGFANTKEWLLEFTPTAPMFVEPLMGWTGMTDTSKQIHLEFDTSEAAIEYAKRNNIEYQLVEPKIRIIKPKSYAANFSYNRTA